MIRKLGLELLGATIIALVATASFARDGQTSVGAHRHIKVSAHHQSPKTTPEIFRDQFALMPGESRIAVPSNMPGAPAQPGQY